MIVRTTVDGRPAAVAYIKQDFTPCSKEQAELVRVHWDDGDTAFLVPQKSAYDHILKYNKCHDPETGRFCSTGGGLSPEVEKGLKAANVWLLKRQAKTNTEAAVVVGEDGKQIFKAEGSANHVSFTRDEVERMDSAYLTHNHPGTRFPCPSAADLQLVAGASLKGVFVCQEDGSFIGATVPILPGIVQEISRAYEFARSLAWSTIESTMKRRLNTTNIDYWKTRNELGAAEGYLVTTILNDLGVIDLTVYNRGTTLDKVDKMVGGLDVLRKDLVDKILNPPDKKPKAIEPEEVHLTYMRTQQLNSTYRYVSGLRKNT